MIKIDSLKELIGKTIVAVESFYIEKYYYYNEEDVPSLQSPDFIGMYEDEEIGGYKYIFKSEVNKNNGCGLDLVFKMSMSDGTSYLYIVKRPGGRAMEYILLKTINDKF